MTNEELYYLPASELLKHIQAEKERLIKEKVIKKSKPLPSITEEEKPYNLPNGWEWVRLGELINYQHGYAFKSKEYAEEGYPIIRMGNLVGGKSVVFSSKNTIYYSEYGNEKIISQYQVKKNDLLICLTDMSPNREFLGNVAIYSENFISLLNQRVLKVNFIQNCVHVKLGQYILNSAIVREQLITKGSGSVQSNLSTDAVLNVKFPLPPLYIQDQIVQKLESLSEIKDSLLSHAESQLNYTKKMREALLQEAIRGELVPQDENDELASILLEKIKVEKEELRLSKNARKESAFPQIEDHEIPFEIPYHWKWIRLGEIGIYKKGPFGSALKKSLFVPKGEDTVKVFEQKNAIQKNITLGDYYISKDYFETSMTGFEVFSGDILVSCAGTIGETYVVPEDSEKGIINQALMKMNIVKSVDVNYFLYYFDFILKNTARESSKGSAIKNIPPFDVFKRLLIPIPPLAEQERIVTKLDELMTNCDLLETKAEEMKNYTSKLFEASLKEAFMPLNNNDEED